MRVEIWTLDEKGNDVKDGEVLWDGKKLSVKVDREAARGSMEEFLTDRIRLYKNNNRDVPPELIFATEEPERFFNNLWRVFQGTYLRATKPKRRGPRRNVKK